MKFIPLTNSELFAIVSDSDYRIVRKFRWYLHKDGGAWKGSQRVNGNRVGRISMHRFVMRATVGMTVDHRNQNRLDNRRKNLRLATYSQNNYYTKKKTRWKRTPSSRFKGVCWDKSRKKWHSSIRLSGKKVNIGRFTSESEAARAYDRFAKQNLGKFALCNF